jgi:GcrA cell cycle regulator
MRFYDEEEALRVRQWWQQGYSAGQIAQMLGTGRTRNSVIGFVNRHMKDRPARKISVPATPRNPRKRGGPKLVPADTSGRRLPEHDRPVPLMLPLDVLKARQCRFACNDADIGETHLFCGADTREGSNFCDYHSAICYTPLIAKSRRKRADILYQAGL